MNPRSSCIILAVAFAIVTPAKSGHELPVYPSFYPHEIELMAVAPDRAADLLLAGKIQAYVGNAPRFATAPPDSIDSIDSLGSFVIVRVNPASPKAKDERSACAIAETVVRDLAGKGGEIVVHPYPVTPFNGDYLHYVDLAEIAKARILGGGPSDSDIQLKVRAGSNLAKSIVRTAWRTQDSDWDAEIAEVGAADLIARASVAINGWSGPAWLRTGWFQTYLLLGELAGNEDLRQRVEPQLQRLKMAAYDRCSRTHQSGAHTRFDARRRLSRASRGLYREARILQHRVHRRHRKHLLRLGDRLQLADVHPHCEAKGFPLERLAHARDRRFAGGRLEPDRGLHRQFRATDVVRGW